MTTFFLTASFALFTINVLLKETITSAEIYSSFASRVTAISNYRSTSGALIEIISQGVTVCASECSHVVDCMSFFYNKQDKLCQLHDIVFEDIGSNLTYVSQTRYYKMNKTVTNFTCPIAPPSAGYMTVLLQDNTVFTYRIVWDLVGKQVAMMACEADGARLVQVLTLAKMKTLVDVFTTCPGYEYAGNYWVDGSNINATDVYDVTQWVTSTGEPLSTTNQFWGPDWPMDTDMYHCVALWSDFEYKWVNPPCLYDNYYICEK